MKKKILIGSLLVLTLLLLMPSIPAIQQKTIEDRTYNDLVEQLNLKDLRDIKVLERLKHPFLFLFVCVIFVSRMFRGSVYFYTSQDWDGRQPIIIQPLLYLRGMMLLSSGYYWYLFWETISEILGFNWDFSFLE